MPESTLAPVRFAPVAGTVLAGVDRSAARVLGVVAQLGPQVLERREAARRAQVLQQVDRDAAAVEVDVDAEQVRLEGGRAVREGGARAHVGHAVEASGGGVDDHREHADGQRLVRVGGDVGGREADGAAALVAADHQAGDAVGEAQHPLGALDVGRRQGLADQARLRDHARRQLQRDHLEVRQGGAQQVEAAGALAPEAEVLADHDDGRSHAARSAANASGGVLANARSNGTTTTSWRRPR
jgi:hypothetical protein